jgi:alpha-beta hydrolase superfamily lysophospholipase
VIKKEEFYFDSRDGEHKLHAVKWLPETETPVCILQIIHGMSEHIERYDDFAVYLAKKGILVVGDDHLGHGRSVKPGEPYGYFCKNDAPTVLVRDEHRLKKMLQEQYVGVPYIILGHSMGSFILRNYLVRYGSGIDGAVIMGTGMPSRASITAALTLAAVQRVFCGEKHISKFLQIGTYHSYFNRIKKPVTTSDWLSSDAEYIQKRRQDKLSGFTFTINGFQTLYRLIRNLYDTKQLEKMPKELPVLFVSGAEDPVGAYGKAVTKVYESYKELGMENVQMKLYAGDRHEILNETDREDVYGDIYRWLLQRL